MQTNGNLKHGRLEGIKYIFLIQHISRFQHLAFGALIENVPDLNSFPAGNSNPRSEVHPGIQRGIPSGESRMPICCSLISKRRAMYITLNSTMHSGFYIWVLLYIPFQTERSCIRAWRLCFEGRLSGVLRDNVYDLPRTPCSLHVLQQRNENADLSA